MAVDGPCPPNLHPYFTHQIDRLMEKIPPLEEELSLFHAQTRLESYLSLALHDPGSPELHGLLRSSWAVCHSSLMQITLGCTMKEDPVELVMSVHENDSASHLFSVRKGCQDLSLVEQIGHSGILYLNVADTQLDEADKEDSNLSDCTFVSRDELYGVLVDQVLITPTVNNDTFCNFVEGQKSYSGILVKEAFG